VSAIQGPNDFLMKTFGAIAAVQIALTGAGTPLSSQSSGLQLEATCPQTACSFSLSLTVQVRRRDLVDQYQMGSAALLDCCASCCALTAQVSIHTCVYYAQQQPLHKLRFNICTHDSDSYEPLQFVGPAMAASPLAPNPLDVLKARTENVARDAKAVANKVGTPDPVKDLAAKTKAAAKKATNPAQEFARKAEEQAKKSKGDVKRGLRSVNKVCAAAHEVEQCQADDICVN
jgi:hypothetical protein